MPLYRQKLIKRADLRANPTWTYVFGDNFERVGYGGQAREMRGEPNAFGIPTKWSPVECFSDKPEELFFVFELWAGHFIALNGLLQTGGVVVWPADGIGTGLARLEESAPRLWQILQAMISVLEENYLEEMPNGN